MYLLTRDEGFEFIKIDEWMVAASSLDQVVKYKNIRDAVRTHCQGEYILDKGPTYRGDRIKQLLSLQGFRQLVEAAKTNGVTVDDRKARKVEKAFQSFSNKEYIRKKIECRNNKLNQLYLKTDEQREQIEILEAKNRAAIKKGKSLECNIDELQDTVLKLQDDLRATEMELMYANECLRDEKSSKCFICRILGR